MKRIALALGFWTFVAVGFCTACRVPQTGPVAKVISCSTEAVQKNWPAAWGPVATCLTGTEGVTPCLLNLIQPAAGISYDLIACLVRDREGAFARAAAANPADIRSARGAQNARVFLNEQKITFAE